MNVIKTYTIGFILSILLTILAYALVVSHMQIPLETMQKTIFVIGLIIIAMIQLCVQLIFFLHIGKESGSKWNLVFFISTFGIILMVIIASIWIMTHLNYNMTPKQINQYLQDQSGGF